jgi:hypothetical protein
LVLTTAKGDGLVVDATTQTGSANLYALEVRVNVHYGKLGVTRREDSASGPSIEFGKARGTFSAPADTQVGDSLGAINFIGRVNSGDTHTLSAITSTCTNVTPVGGNPGQTGSGVIDFLPGSAGSPHLSWQMSSELGVSALIGYGTAPSITPDSNQVGTLGDATHIWARAVVNRVDAMLSVCVGASTPGAGATQVVVLPASGTVLPPISGVTPKGPANQVYLCAQIAASAVPSSAAVLSLVQEAPVMSSYGLVPNCTIPVIYNGVFTLLFGYIAPA